MPAYARRRWPCTKVRSRTRPGWAFRARVPGDAALSKRIIRGARNTSTSPSPGMAVRPRRHGAAELPAPRYDLAGHPGQHQLPGPPLTPLHRAWAFGEALRRACDSVPERIALIGTGGISHWPATPDSGKINEAWDRDFLDRWARNDRAALLGYTDGRPIETPARAASRSGPLSPQRSPRRAGRAKSCSARRFRSSPSAVRRR